MTKRQFFIRYAKGQNGKLLLLLITTLVSVGLNLYLPQLIRRFLNQAKSEGSLDHLIRTAGIYMAAAVAIQVLTLVSSYLGELISWLSTNRLREDLARHCLRLDMSFHKNHKPGELVTRIDDDVNETRGFFSTLFVSFLSNIPLFIGVLVFLWMEDWRIGLLASILAIVILIILPWSNKKCAPYLENVRETHAQLTGDIQEWIQGREDIQASSAVGYMLVKLFNRYRQRYRASMDMVPWNTFRYVLSICFPLLCYTVAYLWSGGVLGGTIPVVSLVVVLSYIDKLEGPLHRLNENFMTIATSQAAFSRITNLLSEQSSLIRGEQRIDLNQESFALSFRDVTFGYNEKEVIRNLSFDLPAGQHMGLLGHTGCGKTTLTRLVLHLYDINSGEILINNGNAMIPLTRVDQKDLNAMFAMVTQEVELFNTTLRNNLTLFNHAIEDDHIIAAILNVSMDDWYSRLPDGLDTVMNGNDGLSAGEAQLLSLARIFLRNPRFIILDEASSRLDPATERKMEQAVSALLKGRTAIIIAHRLETVLNVDRILILKEGAVLEHGSRESLLADQGSVFNQLLNTGLEEALV